MEHTTCAGNFHSFWLSITTHKSQSMTAHNGIVYEPSKNKPFARGLPYVAISRATDIEKVAFLSPIRPDHFINKTFLAENLKITEFYNNLNKNLILMKKYSRLYVDYKRQNV
jgi:ATP-dependent exoDNAse (exonuclease V) alpha subunit